MNELINNIIDKYDLIKSFDNCLTMVSVECYNALEIYEDALDEIDNLLPVGVKFIINEALQGYEIIPFENIQIEIN